MGGHMKVKFILSLLLIPLLFVSCGSETNTSSDDDSSNAAAVRDSEIVPSNIDLSENEKLDLTVNIAGIKLTGSVRVKTLTSNGSLYAYLYIPGMSATATIKGKINGSSFTISNFDMEHEFADGSIENLEGTIDSSGNYATGTFDFLMNQGDELSGTFTIAKQGYTISEDEDSEETEDSNEASSSSTSLDDFLVINYTYDMFLNIAGFELPGTTATLTSYNETSGALKVIFENEEYDIKTNVTCTLKIKEESLTCNPFTISSDFVTGSLSNITGEFNPVNNLLGGDDNGEMGLEGKFDFKLEASDLFDQYVGSMFGGTFLIME